MEERDKIDVSALKKFAESIQPKDESVTITTLSDPRSLCTVKEFLPTGCLPMDLILGGGYPMGRITEIYGDNSTGKSLLAIQAAIEAQHMGAVVVFADVESAVSVPLAQEIGLDIDRIVYFTPDTLTELFQTFETAMDKKDKEFGAEHPMLFIWDSVAATGTAIEHDEKDLDKRMYSAGAIQISRAMRSGIVRKMARSNVCGIFTNQVRQNIGVMFGDSVVTYGGKAIGFYATTRIHLKTTAKIKDGKKIVGVHIKLETTKNKVFPPYRSLTVPVYFGHGTDEPEAVLDMLKDMNVVTTAGAYHYIELGGEKVAFQRPTWEETYDANYEEVERILREKYEEVG